MTSTPRQPNASHQQRLDELAKLLFTKEVSLAAWSAYDELPGTPEDSPQDDRSLRQRLSHRDADVWNTVAPIRAFTREMVSVAEAQRQQLERTLGDHSALVCHWGFELQQSEEALGELDTLAVDYRARLDSLPASVAAGTPEHEALIDARNTKAWHAVRKLSLYVSAVWLVHQYFERYMPRAEDRSLPPVPSPSRDVTRGPRR